MVVSPQSCCYRRELRLSTLRHTGNECGRQRRQGFLGPAINTPVARPDRCISTSLLTPSLPHPLSQYHSHLKLTLFTSHSLKSILHSSHTYSHHQRTTNTVIMHRTYSMRQSRAPTASQIQNPPPPTSSTKSGRFFGKASVGASYVFFVAPGSD